MRELTSVIVLIEKQEIIIELWILNPEWKFWNICYFAKRDNQLLIYRFVAGKRMPRCQDRLALLVVNFFR